MKFYLHTLDGRPARFDPILQMIVAIKDGEIYGHYLVPTASELKRQQFKHYKRRNAEGSVFTGPQNGSIKFIFDENRKIVREDGSVSGTDLEAQEARVADSDQEEGGGPAPQDQAAAGRDAA